MTKTLSCTLIFLFVTFAGSSLAQDLTGEQIIQKVNDLMNQETMYGRMTMTIVTTSGQERTFEYES